MTTIVVGVDGSEDSWNALSWATHEALLRGAEIEIVHAWQITPGASLYVPIDADMDEIAKGVAEEASERVQNELRHGQKLMTKTTTVHQPIAPALIEASEHADLLVVGSRGHGAFSGLFLGSVSLHCATHARCPVVIVRPTSDRETAS